MISNDEGWRCKNFNLINRCEDVANLLVCTPIDSCVALLLLTQCMQVSCTHKCTEENSHVLTFAAIWRTLQIYIRNPPYHRTLIKYQVIMHGRNTEVNQQLEVLTLVSLNFFPMNAVWSCVVKHASNIKNLAESKSKVQILQYSTRNFQWDVNVSLR